jgi:hypothetical protein
MCGEDSENTAVRSSQERKRLHRLSCCAASAADAGLSALAGRGTKRSAVLSASAARVRGRDVFVESMGPPDFAGWFAAEIGGKFRGGADEDSSVHGSAADPQAIQARSLMG